MSASTRRSFLGSTVAAAALPLIPQGKRFRGPVPAANPSTIPVWAVVDVENGPDCEWIAGHEPSRSLAEARIEQGIMRHRKHAIRRVNCRTTGRVFRVLEIEWATYSERCMADPGAFKPQAPRHLLDVPQVIVSDHTEHRAEASDYTDRATALEQAAEFNREQLDGDEFPKDWAVVVEVSEQLPDCATADLVFAGDVGVETRTLTYAVRVVRPTEDEIRRFGGVA